MSKLCEAVSADDSTVRCTQPAGHGPFVYIDEDDTIDADHGAVERGAFWTTSTPFEGSISLEVTAAQFETILIALEEQARRSEAFGEVYSSLVEQV